MTTDTRRKNGKENKVLMAFRLRPNFAALLRDTAKRNHTSQAKILETLLARHAKGFSYATKAAAALAICWHLRHHDHNAVMMAVTCIALPKPIDRFVHQLWEHRTGWKIAAILSVWVASALMLL